MQIAALPVGASTLSPQPAGPALGYGANSGLPTLIRQWTGHSSSAAPSSFTLSGFTASLAGTFLIALVSVAQSGAATVSTPSGWTAVTAGASDNAAHTLGGRLFVYPNNPGGITSVAFTSLSGVNGIAVSYLEWSNVYAVDSLYQSVATPGGATYSNSSASVSAPSYTTLQSDPLLLVGFECDVTGQAYTANNVGTAWVAGTSTTSSSGATNTTLRPFYVVTTPNPRGLYQINGSLAGAIASGAAMLSLLTATTGSNQQPQPEFALTGIIGGLGPTQPGGAGGGQ